MKMHVELLIRQGQAADQVCRLVFNISSTMSKSIDLHALLRHLGA